MSGKKERKEDKFICKFADMSTLFVLNFENHTLGESSKKRIFYGQADRKCFEFEDDMMTRGRGGHGLNTPPKVMMSFMNIP